MVIINYSKKKHSKQLQFKYEAVVLKNIVLKRKSLSNVVVRKYKNNKFKLKTSITIHKYFKELHYN